MPAPIIVDGGKAPLKVLPKPVTPQQPAPTVPAVNAPKPADFGLSDGEAAQCRASGPRSFRVDFIKIQRCAQYRNALSRGNTKAAVSGAPMDLTGAIAASSAFGGLLDDFATIAVSPEQAKEIITASVITTMVAGAAVSLADIGSDFFDFAVGGTISHVWNALLDYVFLEPLRDALRPIFRYEHLGVRVVMSAATNGLLSDAELVTALKEHSLKDGEIELAQRIVARGKVAAAVSNASQYLGAVRDAYKKGYRSEADLRAACIAEGLSPSQVDKVVRTEQEEGRTYELDQAITALKLAFRYDQLDETQLATALDAVKVQPWRRDLIVQYATAGKKPVVAASGPP